MDIGLILTLAALVIFGLLTVLALGAAAARGDAMLERERD